MSPQTLSGNLLLRFGLVVNRITHFLSPKKAELEAVLKATSEDRSRALVKVEENRLEIERALDELKDARRSKGAT